MSEPNRHFSSHTGDDGSFLIVVPDFVTVVDVETCREGWRWIAGFVECARARPCGCGMGRRETRLRAFHTSTN